MQFPRLDIPGMIPEGWFVPGMEEAKQAEEMLVEDLGLPSPVTCILYSPKYEEWLIQGCDGQHCLWNYEDITQIDHMWRIEEGLTLAEIVQQLPRAPLDGPQTPVNFKVKYVNTRIRKSLRDEDLNSVGKVGSRQGTA